MRAPYILAPFAPFISTVFISGPTRHEVIPYFGFSSAYLKQQDGSEISSSPLSLSVSETRRAVFESNTALIYRFSSTTGSSFIASSHIGGSYGAIPRCPSGVLSRSISVEYPNAATFALTRSFVKLCPQYP